MEPFPYFSGDHITQTCAAKKESSKLIDFGVPYVKIWVGGQGPLLAGFQITIVFIGNDTKWSKNMELAEIDFQAISFGIYSWSMFSLWIN